MFAGTFFKFGIDKCLNWWYNRYTKRKEYDD